MGKRSPATKRAGSWSSHLFGGRLGSVGLENAGGIVGTASHLAEIVEVVVKVEVEFVVGCLEARSVRDVKEMKTRLQECCQESKKGLSEMGSGDQGCLVAVKTREGVVGYDDL